VIRIDTKTGRDRLETRREPYWRKLTQGRYLGLRKSDSGGTWIARYRTEDRKQRYRSLGEFSERFTYDQAVSAALAWFKSLDEGVTGRTIDGGEPTVEMACREYVADLDREDRKPTAHEVDMRFRRTVYGDKKYSPHPIASIKLSKIRAAHVKEWRSGLLEAGASKASANRNTAALKAALNLAVKARLVSMEKAREWSEVKRLKDAGKRRDLFLDLHQRRRLRDACEGSVRNLVEAAMLTGCRAGELTKALRSAFDDRTRTFTVKTGKTGRRSIPLSPDALALLRRLSQYKMPNAPLFTRDDGKPWGHSDWDELVREAAKKAGLPKGVCLYTLRHSFITQTLMEGLSTLEVSKMVGTSLAMIEQHYGHLVTDTARERLAKVQLL
jgi:integrase